VVRVSEPDSTVARLALHVRVLKIFGLAKIHGDPLDWSDLIFNTHAPAFSPFVP